MTADTIPEPATVRNFSVAQREGPALVIHVLDKDGQVYELELNIKVVNVLHANTYRRDGIPHFHVEVKAELEVVKP